MSKKGECGKIPALKTELSKPNQGIPGSVFVETEHIFNPNVGLSLCSEIFLRGQLEQFFWSKTWSETWKKKCVPWEKDKADKKKVIDFIKKIDEENKDLHNTPVR